MADRRSEAFIVTLQCDTTKQNAVMHTSAKQNTAKSIVEGQQCGRIGHLRLDAALLEFLEFVASLWGLAMLCMASSLNLRMASA
jgi:hypothetical protein